MAKSRASRRRNTPGPPPAHTTIPRARVAHAAARLMAENGIQDFRLAKQKAAARLGVFQDLPRNDEIETALMAHRRIFDGNAQPQRIRRLRQAAVEAMAFFQAFDPRLVGPVLRGSAGENADVNLHLFTDGAEEVEIHLMDHRIPFDAQERRLREEREIYRDYPAYRFLADDTPIDLTVFPRKGLRKAPLSPVDGKPMERADIQRVRTLIKDSGENTEHAEARRTQEVFFTEH